MIVNLTKSSFYFPVEEVKIKRSMIHLFSFPSYELDNGFKYLGYMLKPKNHGITDWKWLFTKVEKKINLWCNRWISRGVQLVLIKFFIEAILVYWHLLAHIPKGVLNKIWKLFFNYI
jgi:hypothetical protein